MRPIKTTIISILTIGMLAGSAVGVAAQSGPAYFTGTIDPSAGTEVEGTYTDGEPDLIRGSATLGQAIETSDERISGTLSRVANSDWHDIVQPESFLATASLMRIENDGGAWRGYGTELAYIPDWEAWDANDPETWSSSETVVLTGEDGYEGLTAIVTVVPNYDGTMAVTGAVFPGEVPPVPEGLPPAESETAE